MEFEQVVVAIVEIERAAFALHPRSSLAKIEAESLDAVAVAIEIGVGDRKGDVIVAALRQRLAPHDRDPETRVADFEEALLGQREGIAAAVIDFPCPQHRHQYLL